MAIDRGPKTWHNGEPELVKGNWVDRNPERALVAALILLCLLLVAIIVPIVITAGGDSPAAPLLTDPPVVPTLRPTATPTVAPTLVPTATPTIHPTPHPTGAPVVLSTPWPTKDWMPDPTVAPTHRPTGTATEQGLLPPGAECQEDDECARGACAYAEYAEDSEKACCAQGRKFHLGVSWDTQWQYFCKDLPTGARCWNHEACDSTWCPDAHCRDPSPCTETAETGRDTGCTFQFPNCAGRNGEKLPNDVGGVQCVRCIKIWDDLEHYLSGRRDDGCGTAAPRCQYDTGTDPAVGIAGQVCCRADGCAAN